MTVDACGGQQFVIMEEQESIFIVYQQCKDWYPLTLIIIEELRASSIHRSVRATNFKVIGLGIEFRP